ncbi:unnamed protein product [Prunus brigantina]
MIESRMVVHEGERGEPSVDSRETKYREMQRNYRVLVAVPDRVLALPHTLEVGSSNQASPSGSVGIVVASALEGVDIWVGISLARRNILTEVKLAELWIDYSVPPYVGLRLPTAADVVRYPPEVLAGYWLIAERRRRGVTLLVTSLLLRSLGGTGGAWLMVIGSVSQGRPSPNTFIPTSSSVKWGPISKEQEDEVERVRSLLSKTERECKNLVTQKNLFEFGLLQGSKCKDGFGESQAKKAETGGANMLGKKRALEEAHRSVMGTGPRLPPFDPQESPKLPFRMEDVYVEGVEKVDFSMLRRQKKEVNLAMHR